ncbi:hypothetical protein DBR42_01175 [Pelomonas sp. HMWF004]|nr:hypothetical protein DBR42_01175 [Pelomonas sp. HMWF004]
MPADWLSAGRITLAAPLPARLAGDLQLIESLATQRDAKIQAITTQAESFTAPMFGLLRSTRSVSLDAPVTMQMVNEAFNDLFPVLFYFKSEYNAARPVSYVPSLNPVFAKPGHPTYPSGHAAQSRLIALTLGAMFNALELQWLAMADEIALNREIAGVHFRADTEAGQQLADRVFILLMAQPAFSRLLPLARAEWPEIAHLR